MNLINTFIIWTWLLGISLVLPSTLPAGGARKSIIEHREDSTNSPLIALKGFNLLSSTSGKPYILTRVQSGTPVKVIKIWDSPKNEQWLLVNVQVSKCFQLLHKRGWVNISKV